MAGARSLLAETARPFPDGPLESYAYGEDLRERAGRFATLLDLQLPLDARVLHVGSGGGELACFLALAGRRVLGLAATESDLGRARALRRRLGTDGVRFRRRDPPEAVGPDETFDCVLAPTGPAGADGPEAGLDALARAVRPGGHLLVGFRSPLVPAGGGAARGCPVRPVGRALAWLEERGFAYVDSVPPVELFRGGDGMRLLRPADAGRWRRAALARGLVQVRWAWTLRRHGGRYVLAGRREGA